jgi:hypothetical protein
MKRGAKSKKEKELVEEEITPENIVEEVEVKKEEIIPEVVRPVKQEQIEVKVEPVEIVPPSEPVFKWKVITPGGFHDYAGHRIYKPGEEFIAPESKVPLAFRDVIRKVEELPTKTQEKVIPGIVPTYTLQEVEGKNLFNVVNQNGKILTGRPITKEKAEKLVKDLSA